MANFDNTAINPGKNFLNSKVTSPFLKLHKSADVNADLKDLEILVKDGFRIINPKEISMQIDSDLMDSDELAKMVNFASEFGNEMSNEIKNAASEIVSDFMQRLSTDIAKIPMEVTSKVATKAIISVKQVIKEAIDKVTVPVEERLEKEQEEQEKNSISNAIDTFTKKATLISKIVEDTMKVKETIIEQLKRYPEQGMKFMMDQGRKQINSAKNAAMAEINDQYDICKQQLEDWEDHMADSIAAKIKANLIIEIDREEKEKLDKIKAKALQIKTDANKILQVSKLKIMAMLGINIPIPLPKL